MERWMEMSGVLDVVGLLHLSQGVMCLGVAGWGFHSSTSSAGAAADFRMILNPLSSQGSVTVITKSAFPGF